LRPEDVSKILQKVEDVAGNILRFTANRCVVLAAASVDDDIPVGKNRSLSLSPNIFIYGAAFF
jgi:hypothetical protein